MLCYVLFFVLMSVALLMCSLVLLLSQCVSAVEIFSVVLICSVVSSVGVMCIAVFVCYVFFFVCYVLFSSVMRCVVL